MSTKAARELARAERALASQRRARAVERERMVQEGTMLLSAGALGLIEGQVEIPTPMGLDPAFIYGAAAYGVPTIMRMRGRGVDAVRAAGLSWLCVGVERLARTGNLMRE